MFEKIIALDKEAFIFLNSLGSKPYDSLWLLITQQVYWTPFFLLVFYLLQKKIGWKNLGIVLLLIAVLLLVSDQTANLFKNTVQRLRPCNDPQIKDLIRVVKGSDSFSFYSGHATNSMATTVFVFLLFKKYYRYFYWLFLFPLIFAFSRIYLGLHYPLDIFTGYAFGAIYGFVFFKVFQYLQTKF